MAVNVMLAPKPKEDDKIDIQVEQNLVKIDNIHETTVKLLDKIYCLGLQDWCPEEQQVKDFGICLYICSE